MIIEDLKKILHGDVLSDDATIKEYSHDYSIFRVKPQVVVFPKDVEDVKALVRFVKSRKENGESVSLTGRSAGTDMSGGPLTDSISVSFTKYFNHIREIVSPFDAAQGNNGYAVVEPGVYFRDFEKEIQKKYLLYPPYPASKDLCAIGGIVNNNSGGEKTLEYGQTKEWVDRVKFVLSDGEEHELRPLSGDDLKNKLEEQGFEGEIYRKLHKLIEENYDAIQAARPKVSKNSTGYFLWDVWDKEKSVFNIVKLITGSQGTLGLLTEARLKLMPEPKYHKLIVVFTKSLDPVPGIVEAVLKYQPESIESYDDKTLGLALRFLPSMLEIMKGSIISLAWSFLPEAWMALRGGLPKMVLMISVTSNDEKDLADRVNGIESEIKKFPVQLHRVKDDTEAEKYWTIRRQSFKLLHSHVKGKDAAAFVDDIIVNPEHMPEFLPQVNAILDRHKDKFTYTIAGHPGNGNFHIIPLVDMKDPEARKIIPEVMEEIYRLTVKYGGSISGEHNDGLIRTPYLHFMYDQKILDLFAEVKQIFDPDGLFNPHKKVGGSLEYSMNHMKTWS